MRLLAPLLGRGFALADGIVPPSWGRLPDAEALIAEAGASPSEAAREGLTRLLDAVAAESALSLLGRVALRYDINRLLRNAQAVEEAHKNPALGAAPVVAPLFILGLPCSGTALLHQVLACDPDNAVPRPVHPNPVPGVVAAHLLSADGLQGCAAITAQVFQSPLFGARYRVPGYLSWLEAQGQDEAFAFHKRFLQVLQTGTPVRWVLESSDNIFALDALIKTYPDARFIVVQRDPVAAVDAVVQLIRAQRAPLLRHVEGAELDAQVAPRWREGGARLRALGIAPERVVQLTYDELVQVPLTAVVKVYGRFGLPLSSVALAGMARCVRP